MIFFNENVFNVLFWKHRVLFSVVRWTFSKLKKHPIKLPLNFYVSRAEFAYFSMCSLKLPSKRWQKRKKKILLGLTSFFHICLHHTKAKTFLTLLEKINFLLLLLYFSRLSNEHLRKETFFLLLKQNANDFVFLLGKVLKLGTRVGEKLSTLKMNIYNQQTEKRHEK